ncbi:MAG TPA: aminoglycoside phosphotransferase family protein [Bacillales bacterium]|nr:aminoglycoside phosphotransferase family protein [Bacillales bacterium]
MKKIRWCATSFRNDFLAEIKDVQLAPLDAGLEAEVMKVDVEGARFVLKIWNKGSKPDVWFQYCLLQTLNESGIAVSKSYGYGYDEAGNAVLLTSFDGVPIEDDVEGALVKLAEILAKIHAFPVASCKDFSLPRYDFIDYFYPQHERFSDLNRVLEQLVNSAKIKQTSLIHGDFHLNNVLEKDGRFTVIDWTNGQLGDPRYDLAWAYVLIRIYFGKKQQAVFLSEYKKHLSFPLETLERFEALACLRWLLLDRIADMPKQEDTYAQVKQLLQANRYLSLNLLELND